MGKFPPILLPTQLPFYSISPRIHICSLSPLVASVELENSTPPSGGTPVVSDAEIRPRSGPRDGGGDQLSAELSAARSSNHFLHFGFHVARYRIETEHVVHPVGTDSQKYSSPSQSNLTNKQIFPLPSRHYSNHSFDDRPHQSRSVFLVAGYSHVSQSHRSVSCQQQSRDEVP